MPPSWNHDTKLTTGHLKWWCLLDVFTAGKFKSVPRIILPHRHHAEGRIIYKSMWWTSNDVNDENEIEMLTMSNKRTIHEDSSEEDTNNPLPAKKAATSSPASEQSGTRVPKGRGGGDLSKISAFPANAPQPRGRGSSQGDKSPARAPRFSNNTSEGSASSVQGGRNRAAINRQSLSKPPGTIKTATKDKTKSREKNTPS